MERPVKILLIILAVIIGSYMIVAGIGTLLFGDRSKMDDEEAKVNDSIFGRALLDNGFLAYADSVKIDSLKADLTMFNIYDEANNKIAHIDAEELVEFQFDFFVPRLNTILGKRKFQLQVRTADDHESSNEIFINNEKLQLYTKEETENGTFWDSGPRTFFRKLNAQLKKENINESFFLLYDGNDLHTLLLTEQQFEIIAGRYKNEPREAPYRP